MASPEDTGLRGRKILLGVTGGIAAYKSAELVRLLKKGGCEVQVLMTPDAGRFITPLTLGTLSGREVLVGIFPESESGSWMQHVALGLWADLMVVAPATAQTIAKLAGGFSDSMLTACALSARCPILVCPSMDLDMYAHPATAGNLGTLVNFGYRIMDPAHGELASGLIGQGRLPEPAEIVDRIRAELARPGGGGSSALLGKRVLVTAGPTREPIDPVRFLSNHSTGTMGFALARSAAIRGASVTLIAGPSRLETPEGVDRLDVNTAQEMSEAVQQHSDCDLVIMAAAVADYTPVEPADTTLKKSGDMSLNLRRTPDILADLGRQKRPGQVLVGFALETQDGESNARRKLERKNLDLVVLNYAGESGAGFGEGTNRVTLIWPDGTSDALPLLDKQAAADHIIGAAIERSMAATPGTPVEA